MRLPDKLSNGFGKMGLKIRKASPEILLGFGFITMGAAIISAVKAAKKHDEIVADHEERLEEAKREYDIPDEYEAVALHESEENVYQMNGTLTPRSQKEINREIRKVYTHTGLSFARLYSKTVFFSIVSACCFAGSYNIQSRRIAGLTITCNGLRDYISQYEKRNIELNGKRSHEMCKYGYKEIEETYEDPETGEMVTEKKLVPAYEAAGDSEGAIDTSKKELLNISPGTGMIIFGKESPEWQGIADLDQYALHVAEHDLLVIYRARGWAVINDLRGLLSMPLTKDGAIDGWVKGFGPEPSLGIKDPVNQRALDGYKNEEWVLNCNIHGNIYSMLTKVEEDEAKKNAELAMKRAIEEGMA